MSTTKISVLREAPKIEADEEIVGLLEKLLQRAKEGKIRSLAFVTELTENQVGTGFAGSDINIFALAGGCEEVKLRLLERYDLNEIVNLLNPD